MTSLSPVISPLQTGHSICRTATLPTSNANTVLLVCAGGSAVSVQAAPRSFLSSMNSEAHNHPHHHHSSNGGSSSGVHASSSLQHLHHSCFDAPSAAGTEAGKGAEAMLSVLQQWRARRSLDNGSSDAVDGAPSPTSALSPEQRGSLQAGEVTALAVASLPSTDRAIAVVGSTVGAVALFLIEGSRTLYKVAERPLLSWSRGAITAQDAVVDVAFSMDPAGRPEFVSAASAGCVVVVDVQLFYRDEESNEEEDERRSAGMIHNGDGAGKTELRGDDAWTTSALRAKAIEALEQPHAQLLRRSRSEVFACAFTEASVVRVLAPQRLHAAVALDVAVVVVLSDGTLRFIERVMEGGAVRLLAEHHRLRFARGSAFIAYAQASPLPTSANATANFSLTQGGCEADSRALPHVIYRYRLSAHQMNVVRYADTSAALNSGGVGGAPYARPGGFGGAAEWVTVVNDAALHFSEKDAVCHVVVAGTQLVPTSKSVSGTTAQGTAVDVTAGVAAGWTLGRLRHETKTAAAAAAGSTGHRALGWWAMVHNAVLPRFTFDRVALERQAFRQSSHNQQRSMNPCSTSAASSLFYQSNRGTSSSSSSFDAESFAAAYGTNAASPFMMHVQSGVMALPAAPLSTTTTSSFSSLATHATRSVAATTTATAYSMGSGGIDGSVAYDGLPSSPVISTPTGTGAHVAASNTTAGLGNGFAAAAMVGGVVVLSAGADVYVGDVSEVPAQATSLPMLRPARSFGAVVESIAPGLLQGARSVLVTSGSCVVPVSL